jgi:perosamine synthetase
MLGEKFVRSSRPFFPKQDIKLITRDIAKVLEEGRLRNGANLLAFERMFAEYIGVKEAVAFDSDGNALETALQYYDVKDCEVVVCTNSFISIPNSVVYSGGKVVFADIREETLSMNPDSLAKNISRNTRGVVVTHIAGFPNPDLSEITEICKRHDLFLIEDATHAVGATINDRKVGTFGNAAIFAFTPTKVLTTGEGGMLVTNDAVLSEEARRFRYYGSGPGKTEFVNLGRHMMLPEVSAIMGIYQLKRVEEFVAARNRIARLYDRKLGRSDRVKTIDCPPGNRSSYYKYPLILGESVNRLKLTGLLEKEYRVETGNVFYPPCHLQSVYRKQQTGVAKELQVSEGVLAKTITLPMHAAMTKEDAEYVVKSCDQALSRLG